MIARPPRRRLRSGSARTPRRRAAAGTPHAGELLAETLRVRWRTSLKHLRSTRAHFSEKAVHDLRVATRRLLAAADIVLAIMPDQELLRRRRRLKRQVDIFDALRDTQVQILALEELVPTHPAAVPYLTMLRVRERALVKRTRTRLRTMKPAVMGRTVALLRRGVLDLGAAAPVRESLRAAMIGSAGTAFARCVQLLRAVDPDRTQTIHGLRLAFKRFRYRMEALAPLTGTIGPAELKRMNAYQVRMGDVQDAQVLVASFNEFVLERPPIRRGPLRAVQMELLRRRTAAVGEFLRGADELHTFWRPLMPAPLAAKRTAG